MGRLQRHVMGSFRQRGTLPPLRWSPGGSSPRRSRRAPCPGSWEVLGVLGVLGSRSSRTWNRSHMAMDHLKNIEQRACFWDDHPEFPSILMRKRRGWRVGFDPSTTIILVETKSRAFYTFTSCGAFVHKL